MCWGINGNGQVGDGTMTNAPLPVHVKTGPMDDLTEVTAVAGGVDHSCAIIGPDGEVKCWGLNMYGQLGNDDITYISTYAVDVQCE